MMCYPPRGKDQAIRILDVLLIGPLMMYGGYVMSEKDSRPWGHLLGILGGLTIWYNGRNYFRIKEQECPPHVGYGSQ